MPIKSFIVPRVAERLLSEDRLMARRRKFERQRLRSGEGHKVEFFHDPADPYSQLLEKVLPEFKSRYEVDIIVHKVGPPHDGAAPKREKLANYAKLDAKNLARKAGIDFKLEDKPAATNTSIADAKREKLGYYLGGALYYGGEWYWGLDRLHYLEDRLKSFGLGGLAEPIFTPPVSPDGSGNSGAELHWYLSFRSPYTGIVADRVKALADAYQVDLKLRFVLPMVMRDLPVPKTKAKYIIMDTAREARRLGIPFGRVCDPVGSPVERGYSLLPWAVQHGRGFEFVSSFLTKVWSQGVDAGSDKGLRMIVEAAGLNWAEAKSLIGNEDWRQEAEANRLEMMRYGIWGVPSFRVNNVIIWGQDRLWVIEDELRKLSKNKS